MPIRSPVVDLDLDRFAVLEVGYLDSRSERQPSVGGGERVLVEAVAACGPFAVKPWSVPRRLADLFAVPHLGGGGWAFAARIRLDRDPDGEDQGAQYHEARETGDSLAEQPRWAVIFVTFVHASISMGGLGRPRNPLGDAGIAPEPLEGDDVQDTIQRERCLDSVAESQSLSIDQIFFIP